MCHGEMSQREVSHVTLRVGRQVGLEWGDGFSVSPGGQVRLADQELGIRGDRSTPCLGQTGEDRIRQCGLPERPVRESELLAGRLVQRRRECRHRLLGGARGGVDK